MVEERRQFQRVDLDSPVVVLLGDSKHSLLFDLCEEGLAVGRLASTRLGEVIPFAFDLPDRNGCIQGRAEVVWTNEAVHRMGLHVLELAETCRLQLSAWISARAFTISSADTETEPVEPGFDAYATDAPVAPLFPAVDARSESQPVETLFPLFPREEFEPSNPALKAAEEFIDRKATHTVLIGLALVVIGSGIGFLTYRSRENRANLQPATAPATTGSAVAEAASPAPDFVPAPAPEPAPEPAKSSLATTALPVPAAPLDLPGFVLQVGAMKQEANADALAQNLQAAKFPAFVYKSGTDGFYRVAVGPYSDENAPVKVKGQLEKRGVKGFTRRWAPE